LANTVTGETWNEISSFVIALLNIIKIV